VPIDKQILMEAVEELIQTEGKDLLTVGWDGGNPGMAGCLWIQEWHSLYFVFSSECDEEGPFTSLEEALQCENFTVITAQPEVSSQTMGLKQLKGVALGLVAEGGTIWINQREFVRKGDKLVKK
jgi:hypothetical protein